MLCHVTALLCHVIIHSGFNDATLVSVSENVYFKDYNVPLQGHLALSGDPTEML